MKMKNQKGITLVAEVITIVIFTIISEKKHLVKTLLTTIYLDKFFAITKETVQRVFHPLTCL